MSIYDNSQKDTVETFVDLDKLPSIVNSEVVTKVVKPILSSFNTESWVKEHVANSISTKLQNVLISNTLEDIEKAITEIQESPNWQNLITSIIKNLPCAIAKNSNYGKIQLIGQGIDIITSCIKVSFYMNNLCEAIKSKLSNGKANNTTSDIQNVRNKLTEQISEQLYDKIVSTTTDKLKDFTAIGTSTDDGSHQDNSEQTNKEIEEIIESPITVQGNKLTKITKKDILGLGAVFNKIKIIKTDIKYIHNEHRIGSDDDITTLGTSISDQD